MAFPIFFKVCRWLAPFAVVLIALPAVGETGSLQVTWEKRIEVAAGGGYRGPWRMNASDFYFVDDPTVAIDQQGAVALAWVDQSRQDIFFQSFGPDGSKRLEKPVNVSRSLGVFSWLPRLVVGADDGRAVYVLWQEIVFSGGSHGGEIFFARSTDGGRAFDKPVNLSNSIPGDGKGRLTRRHWDNGSLDLALGPKGTLYAAWTEYEGRLWFSRSTDNGATFTDPLHVNPGADQLPARGPSLAVGAGGRVYLAWTVGEDAAADIRITESVDDGGSFGASRVVLASDGHADAPKIAVDGTGTVHLVYGESAPGSDRRYHVKYARSNKGPRGFEASREISGPLAPGVESASFPALSLDSDGTIFVLWELFPRPRYSPQGLGYTHSADGGRTFAPPSVVPGSRDAALGVNGSQQGLLMRKLAINGAGAIAVVNSTFKRNQESRVWLHRGRAVRR